MPATYTLISSNVLASTAASVTFSSIPATYTDLVLRVSVRRSASGRQNLRLAVNGSTSDGSYTYVRGNGATATSAASTAEYIQIVDMVPSTAETSDTFGSGEFYIPNYLASANKPIGGFGVGENNATTSYITAVAGLYSQTTAISSLVLSMPSGSFVSGSSFYLYGISNA